jgi:hypothetical protein
MDLATNLVQSMKNRISDVIANNGDFIMYWWSECELYLYNISVFGKFVQLTSNHMLETFGLRHSIEGAFLLRYTNFGPIDSFPS